MKDYCTSNKIDNNSNSIRSAIKSNSIRINTYHDLIMEIAELSYKNPEVMLFYRGQTDNYKKVRFSTLYPTIFRSANKKEIEYNFKILKVASDELLSKLVQYKEEHEDEIDDIEIKEIKEIKMLQHSILQHYGVCNTPFLDVTQSLKVACSFATIGQKTTNKVGYIYVLGLPYISGRISINSEEYITNVRLLSISSSLSKRPFFQEGYLVKTEFTSSRDVDLGELDFNNRIVAIYEFDNNEKFWGKEKPIFKEDLYPDHDIMGNICEKIEKSKFYLISNSKEIGDFIIKWNKLEKMILKNSGGSNITRGISELSSQNGNFNKESDAIELLRKYRNTLVHDSEKVNYNDLENKMNKLDGVIKRLKID